MSRFLGGVLPILVLALAACGGTDATAVTPDTDEFIVDSDTQERIDDAADSGDGAEGSYDYVAARGELTISVSSSSFSCIETGPFVADVTELSSTTMVWEFDDGGGVTWSRLDEGTEGVAGIWHTTDPDLYLVLSGDGEAQIFGEAPCDDDDDRGRNNESCYELGLTGIDVDFDGNASEWGAVHNDGSLSDPADDHQGGDAGADLAGFTVEYFGSALYILMELHGAPSTAFQAGPPPNDGVYRLTIRGDNGLSLSERLFFSSESGWQTMGDAEEVSAVVGDVVEWRVDLSDYEGEGFRELDLIMVEPIGCSESGCGTLDEMNCGFLSVPQPG